MNRKYIKNKNKTPKKILLFFIWVFFILINISCKSSNENKSLHIIHMGKDITNEVLDFNPKELEDNEERIVNIEDIINNNVLSITNNSVRCIEANCRDNICVKKGKITGDYDNDMIVCMPHGLIVYYD